MLKCVYGRSHFELEKFIDMESFDKIQIDIWKGIALTKSKVTHGYFPFPIMDDISEMHYNSKYKSLMEAYIEYRSQSPDDPIRAVADELAETAGHNVLATFLKYAYDAHDLHSHYPLWDQGNTNNRKFSDIAEHFPTLIRWIDKLVEDKIFSKINRAFIIGIDCNGYAHEHFDPPTDPDRSPEFIHVRPNLNRPFYIRDIDTDQKYYVNSRVGWWNDGDVHGGEPTMGPSYALRIDGIFHDEFRNLIKNII